MTKRTLLCSLAISAAFGLSISPAHGQSCREWRLRATTGPSPRGEFGLIYDSRRSMTVLVGGAQNLGFSSVFRETWEWNGQAWSLVSTAGPTKRCDNAVSYDTTRDVLTSFGGYDGTFLRDTWTWNGAAWQQKSTTGPSARADASMAFDPIAGGMILFGGLEGGTVQTVMNDTWRWNGTAWTALTPAMVPPARWIHRAAYDAARGEIVFFGGAAPGVVLGDMWAWTGSNWSLRTPATLPPARYANALAYDTHRQTIVLFGGQNGIAFGTGPLGDTWEWDGTNWSTLPPGGPSARTFVKMVYDQRRRKLVLFGGHDGTQFLNDTWELGSDLDIVTDPTPLHVAPGAPAQMHVVAGGTGPFTYQWLKDGVPLVDGGHVSGATTDTLVLDPAESGDTGGYAAVVSNACGPVNSREASLLVAVVPGEATLMLASYDRETGNIQVTYAPACSATDHILHSGPLAGARLYLYTASACALGTSGTASFNPGTASFFFLIAGNDGSTEGSYGKDSHGVERPAEMDPSACTLPQNPDATCE
jgi:hypothetical protein